MKKHVLACLLPLLIFLLILPEGKAQVCCESTFDGFSQQVTTAYDSALNSRIPVIPLPEEYRLKTLPSIVDNSTLPFFPGPYAQFLFYSCQQYSGITFDYAYEVNRLRNVSGLLPENRYPAHFTWNFLNWGGQFIGVNFLHTFHALIQQGQMSQAQYGPDTAQRYLGWISGYEKYEKAFPNRIKGVRAIPVNSEEGILTLKHFLNDHLDGSATGGVACFTAAGPIDITTIPDGLPEAGKHLVVNWLPWATHGMTIVGYNDSVRCDLNSDGQFTNNIDINGDGIVDVRDWEIGAFKFANSYGSWWGDGGFGYALYHAMASRFEQGGVWNDRVYVVDPDTAYAPLLGMKFSLKYNKRNQLKITAGVSTDTAAELPEHILEFPYFNYQGGPHVMGGKDSIPGNDEIELGLDVTPLLGYVLPGQAAKFFFMVQEEDPYFLGSGLIRQVSFIDYSSKGTAYTCTETNVPIRNQGTTYLSAVGKAVFTPLEITTESLPPCSPGQSYSAQLAAQGGKEPYRWTLLEKVRHSPISPGYTGVNDLQLYEESDEIVYAKVVLPFSFPFFGKTYDTVYMNNRGMVQFTNDQIPYPYLIDWNDMLRNVPVIFPAFSGNHRVYYPDGEGMWVRTETDKVTFRWKVSRWGYETSTDNSFELVLLPDGSFEFHYGPVANAGTADWVQFGYSKGDDANCEISPECDLATLSGQSFRYFPTNNPAGILLSENGLLTLSGTEAEKICDITVRVTDERLFVAEKTLQLSTGLMIEPALQDPSGLVHFGAVLPLGLKITNTGSTALSDLHLTLSCEEPLVVLADTAEIIASLAGGEQADLLDAFSFSLAEHMADQSLIWFHITATDSSTTWNYTFPAMVGAPDIRLMKADLHDGANHLLDPGEISDLEIELGNYGARDADSVLIIAASSDTLVAILDTGLFAYSSLPCHGELGFSLRLRASRMTEAGTPVQITLKLTGSEQLDKEFVIDLQIGSRPVAIVSLTQNTTSIQAMKAALDELSVPYDHYEWVGNPLLNYPLLFLILGNASGSHTMTDNESVYFSGYLDNGGRMYMETYADWYYNEDIDIVPRFHLETGQVPIYSFAEVTGAPSTIFEGMDFPYSGNYQIATYDMLPVDPGFTLLGNTDAPPHAVQVGYDGDDYKTIASMVEFGRLDDGAYPSTKTSLMEKYLEFFQVLYKGPYPYFHADSTTTCRFHPVHFTDDSFDNIISREWEFPGGQPSSSTAQNPVVIYPDAGKFNVTLTVSDGTTSHTLIRKEYIRIEVCAGQNEIKPSLSEMVVYPNPARTELRLKFPENIIGPVDMALFGLSGKLLVRSGCSPAFTNSGATISLSDIPSGFYLLRVTSGRESETRKVVVIK